MLVRKSMKVYVYVNVFECLRTEEGEEGKRDDKREGRN